MTSSSAALRVERVDAFHDNYIWLIRRQKFVAVVDPGDASPVEAMLREHDLTPIAILVTHHHADHVGGVNALLRTYDTPVYGPVHEPIPARTHALAEGDTVSLPALDLRLTVFDVPGHTRAAVAYYGAGLLFCGDTLFCGGCGRLFEGTAAQMHASLRKLARLPASTLVYCAHEYTLANLAFAVAVEPENAALAQRVTASRSQRQRGEATVPSTLAAELATNPFLRCNEAPVRAAADAHAGACHPDATAVFATIRRWKDGFRAPAEAL